MMLEKISDGQDGKQADEGGETKYTCRVIIGSVILGEEMKSAGHDQRAKNGRQAGQAAYTALQLPLVGFRHFLGHERL